MKLYVFAGVYSLYTQ